MHDRFTSRIPSHSHSELKYFLTKFRTHVIYYRYKTFTSVLYGFVPMLFIIDTKHEWYDLTDEEFRTYVVNYWYKTKPNAVKSCMLFRTYVVYYWYKTSNVSC